MPKNFSEDGMNDFAPGMKHTQNIVAGKYADFFAPGNLPVYSFPRDLINLSQNEPALSVATRKHLRHMGEYEDLLPTQRISFRASVAPKRKVRSLRCPTKTYFVHPQKDFLDIAANLCRHFSFGDAPKTVNRLSDFLAETCLPEARQEWERLQEHGFSFWGSLTNEAVYRLAQEDRNCILSPGFAVGAFFDSPLSGNPSAALYEISPCNIGERDGNPVRVAFFPVPKARNLFAVLLNPAFFFTFLYDPSQELTPFHFAGVHPVRAKAREKIKATCALIKSVLNCNR